MLKTAARAVHDELRARAETVSGDGKAVLEATALMAKDTMLIKGAAKLVARGTSAQRAIWESGSSVAEMLHNLGGYMAERATDILDVRARIVAELRGVPAPRHSHVRDPLHPRGRGPGTGRHRNPGPE